MYLNTEIKNPGISAPTSVPSPRKGGRGTGSGALDLPQTGPGIFTYAAILTIKQKPGRDEINRASGEMLTKNHEIKCKNSNSKNVCSKKKSRKRTDKCTYGWSIVEMPGVEPGSEWAHKVGSLRA